MKMLLSRGALLSTLMFSLALLLGCAGGANAQQDAGRPAAPAAAGKPVMLTIHGYNYTDRYIDRFAVNGVGGGNLYVSGPGSGGGGSTCCVRYVPGTPAPFKVRVKWVAGGCTFTTRNMYNEESKHIRHFFREQEVAVDTRVPANPENFEVHFYQDGHVEAAITDDYSPPRLNLKEEREIKPTYQPCPGNRDPGPGADDD